MWFIHKIDIKTKRSAHNLSRDGHLSMSFLLDIE